jgi:hypothetical protein
MHVDHRDSGRLGKAVEHLVAATCILTSGLQLNVSTSFVDDEGVDLVFARRGEQKTLAVQVKSRRISGASMSKGTFRAQVGDSTFTARDDLYLLYVLIDPEQGTFDRAWFVPSKVLHARSTVNPQGRRRFVANANPASRDQWSEFSCARIELADRILDAIDSLP